MRTIKGNKVSDKQSGFTLVEIALVLLLLGLILTPAIQMYHQYRIDKDWSETEDDIDDIKVSLGGFRSVYGRYPCPAPITASPGNIDYGHELADCRTTAPPPGTCSNGICTYTSISGENVAVGAIPFKILNLTEKQAYDSSLGRVTYAVTLGLTTNATFDMNGGGISIIDKNNPAESLISPADSAHFVIISHGKNQSGSYTRAGIISQNCTTGSLAEQENCDADTIFTSGDYDATTFDDRVTFFSPVHISEWQTSEAQANAITLKNTDSSAIGANITQNLTGEEEAVIFNVGSTVTSGIIRASSQFLSERICDEPTGRCFRPELIAGTLDCSGTRCQVSTPDNGMSCYTSGGSDNFMVAVENNGLFCADEVFVSCPDNQLISGIINGEISCSPPSGVDCNATTRTSACGPTVNVPFALDGEYGLTYTGECRMIQDYSRAYFLSIISLLSHPNQINSVINYINSPDRTIIACDTSPADSQIRDAWLCTDGTFGATRAQAHEKDSPWSTYPSNPVSNATPWPAEIGNNSTADPNNNQTDHDCWCREDYRAQLVNCPSGLSGNRIVIAKHTCPQTRHRWTHILNSDKFCACSPGTENTYQSCNSYYDEVNGTSGTNGLIGTVKKTFDVNCVNGSPVTSASPSSVDFSQCACPSRPQLVNRASCQDAGNPISYTNSWSWSGGAETNVATLSTQDWSCPSSSSGGLPDPGSWGSVTPHSPIPACTCDDNSKAQVTLVCPAGQQGSGITYEREWDCSTNSWEPQEDWDLVANNCSSCTWQAPNGTPTLEEFPYGEPNGAQCTCGSAPAPQCHDFAGGGRYSVWNGCQCVVQH